MLGFLKIVLAVVVVLVALLVVGWFWIKRRFNQAVNDYSMAAELVDPADFKPARLHLYRLESVEACDAFVALREQLGGLGFQRIAEFGEGGGAFVYLLAMRHRDLPIAAAAIQEENEDTHFCLFTLSAERHVAGRANGGMTCLSTGNTCLSTAKLDWQMRPELDPETALAELQSQVTSDNLMVDLRHFRAVYEQVWAVAMDRKIAHQPTREDLERRAAERSAPLTEKQLENAYVMVIEHWKSQVEEAVLDTYRRSSKIDAVAWESLRDVVHVVHARSDDEDIADLLAADEVSERIFEQCQAQGLSGVELYEAVARQLPADRQWVRLGEVDTPIRAVLFAPNEDIDSDVPAARAFVYDAEDASGNKVQGAIYAENGQDAKRQVRNLGLEKTRLLIEPLAGFDQLDESLIDDQIAAIAAKAVQESVLSAVLRAIVSNWWIWAPPAVFVGLLIKDPGPLAWTDYLSIAWAAAAATAMAFLIGPVIAYNQLLLARLRARPRQAHACLKILEILNLFNGMTPSQIRSERCKIMAMDGDLNAALALWEEARAEITEEEFQTVLAQIYDSAGDVSSMMEAQRAFLDITQSRDMAAIDLAMSMARYADDIDEAETLMQSIVPADLSEMALAGYQYARGLLAARRGRLEQALQHYAQATETASQFIAVPIVLGLIAEINGYAALALKQSGDKNRAQALWDQVAPILRLHRSSRRLVADFESS